MAYVYRHIRLDKNEPFYIGVGSDCNGKYSRAYDRFGRSEFWNKIISKCDYEVEIMIDEIPFEYAKIKEIEFIALYGRKDLGTGTLVNMTIGGDGTSGLIFDKEHRERSSIAAKKRPPQPQLQKIIEWKKNNNNFFTAEVRDKISKALSGRSLTESHKEKGRVAKVGVKNPMYGKKGYDCPNFRGLVYAYKDGIEIGKYYGVHDAANKLGLQATKISACILGKRNKTGGYTFRRR